MEATNVRILLVQKLENGDYMIGGVPVPASSVPKFREKVDTLFTSGLLVGTTQDVPDMGFVDPTAKNQLAYKVMDMTEDKQGHVYLQLYIPDTLPGNVVKEWFSGNSAESAVDLKYLGKISTKEHFTDPYITSSLRYSFFRGLRARYQWISRYYDRHRYFTAML